MKTLAEIRHMLVVAAQKDYDDRIARGIHPYAMASYHFTAVIDKELAKHVEYKTWKADNWRELDKAFDIKYYNRQRSHFGDNEGVDFCQGQWAVGAYLNSAQAWATPGFAEAYRHHSVYGG
jgi:hypothetical protein